MRPHNEIDRFCRTVCEQIRWTKARELVYTEMEQHLCDQRDAYLAAGEKEDAAARRAVAEMGDPVSIGANLDRVHRPKPQWFMTALAGGMLLAGMLFQYVIDVSPYSLQPFRPFPFVFAAAVFFICCRLDFTILGRHPLFCCGTVLVLSLGALPFASRVNGHLWWVLGLLSFNLACLSLIYPLAFALLVYSQRNRGLRGILICAAGFLSFAAILAAVPSATGLILYLFSAFAIFCWAAHSGQFGAEPHLRHLVVLLSVGSTAAALAVAASSGGFLKKIRLCLDPYSDPNGAGYLGCLVRDTLAGARLFGRGTLPARFGEAVPADALFFGTDYVLTAGIHIFGWAALAVVLALAVSFAVFGFRRMIKQKSVLGKLVSLSILLPFALQSVIYVAANLGYGILPPLSLPLISYGKTALVINAGLLGFLLSVFRTGEAVRDRDGKSPHIRHAPFLTYENGKLIVTIKEG